MKLYPSAITLEEGGGAGAGKSEPLKSDLRAEWMKAIGLSRLVSPHIKVYFYVWIILYSLDPRSIVELNGLNFFEGTLEYPGNN